MRAISRNFYKNFEDFFKDKNYLKSFLKIYSRHEARFDIQVVLYRGRNIWRLIKSIIVWLINELIFLEIFLIFLFNYTIII